MVPISRAHKGEGGVIPGVQGFKNKKTPPPLKNAWCYAYVQGAIYNFPLDPSTRLSSPLCIATSGTTGGVVNRVDWLN